MREIKSTAEPLKLRYTLVGMLFALTVAHISVSLVASVFRALDGVVVAALPSILHLLVALLVLTSSWVGWSLTAAASKSKQVEDIFHLPFVVLLLDIMLVMVYYAIAVTAEISTDGTTFEEPSANHEIYLGIAVLCIYFVWDITYDVLMTNEKCWKRAFVTTFASLASIVLIFVLWRVYIISDQGLYAVVFADVSLILVFVIFRALKGGERFLADLVGLEATDIVERNYAWRRWSVWSFVLFLMSLLLLCFTQEISILRSGYFG